MVYQVPEASLSSLKQSLRKFIGKNVIVHYLDNNGKTIFKLDYKIPSSFSSWWKTMSWSFIGENYDLVGGSMIGNILYP